MQAGTNLPGPGARASLFCRCARKAAPYGASEERREISVYILGLRCYNIPNAGKGAPFMQRIVRILRNLGKKGDFLLLFMSLLATVFVCVVIS